MSVPKARSIRYFELSFDARQLGYKDVEQVLNYLHRNPVTGIWNLVYDYADFMCSSASYYEEGLESFYELIDFREVDLESSSSDSK